MRNVFNELKKIRFLYFAVFIIAFVVMGNILVGFLYHDEGMADEKALIQERNDYQSMCDLLEEEDVQQREIFQRQIDIIDYCLENKISYQKLSVWGNLAKNGIYKNIILILMVVASYSLVEVENKNNTWKNQFIINRNHYGRILFRKKSAEYILVFGIIGLFVLVSLLYGAIRYGDWNNVKVAYEDGRVLLTNYDSEIKKLILDLLFKGIVYSDLAMLMGIYFKSGKCAVILPVIMIFFRDSIATLLDRLKIGKIFPYQYMDTLLNCTGCTIKQYTMAILYLFVFLVVLFLLIRRGVEKQS